MNKRELKEKIENIEITYNYEESYNNLYNTCIDYMNETQDFELDYLFQDYISYELAEEITKQEIENGGLERLRYFLGNTDLFADIFKIDGYGNLENIDKDHLEMLKDEIIENLKEEK